MKIVLLQTGKTADKYISEGVADYLARITRMTGFEIITVPDLKYTGKMPPAEQTLREGRAILNCIRNDDYVVLLDRKGKALDTIGFASELQKFLLMPKKRVLFLIGGAWGVSEEVYKRANFILSLSKMTFSHQMVRLLFIEQLYRALTIIKGIPYHHE
ncbi:MAG TPA: 23S rRNA (pseudouridine(1915)-N(3))-methyltransferase RlmH [Bacteroidales bacterium]|nr:23S rRNA (pseudouridine(1915)-N(3))-methyltransferase RlmH [Bacteroidales bacterium]